MAVRGLRVEQQAAVLRVSLNRPDRRNALTAELVRELAEVFEAASENPAVRAVVLGAEGPVFCAGADLQWMKAAGAPSEERARGDAELLMRLYQAIDACACPVIGRVQGPAFGGGVGLMAVCDMVVARQDASFTLSEVRLGLVPAVIMPFLLRKTGESFLRRYALTGDPFSAAVARQFTLVHDVVPNEGLDERIAELEAAALRAAPGAVRETKALIRRMRLLEGPDQAAAAIGANVQARLSAEAHEGLEAFLDKRPPRWAGARPDGSRP
ncbi:enoyl-CoA hydratase-related protein [Candidatus Nitrospira bockiana]